MNKSNVIVSEQNLIDCDAASSGCSFGHPFDGLKYALSAGITDAKSYPYIALGVSWLSYTCFFVLFNYIIAANVQD